MLYNRATHNHSNESTGIPSFGNDASELGAFLFKLKTYAVERALASSTITAAYSSGILNVVTKEQRAGKR